MYLMYKDKKKEYMKLIYNVFKIQNMARHDQGCGPASLKCGSVQYPAFHLSADPDPTFH
jgi:hypothetical protein